MLEEHGIIRKYQDGETIFKQGEKGREMYIIRLGKVKIFRKSDSKQVTLATLGVDDFFGEMALFGDLPRSATVQAVGQTELLAVDKGIFMNLIKEPVVWKVLERMSQRLRDIDDQLESLVVKEQLRREYVSSMIAHRKPII